MWQAYTHSDPAGSLPYFVHVPSNYHVGTPVSLIIMLHGCTQTASDFAAGTRMNLLAEQYNFIVAYPQQTSNHNRSLCWNWFQPSSQSRDQGEPAIIAGIVQAIEQNKTRWTIDPRRIYVAGLSAGAAMATILGATYPDLFAAIGTHSGLQYGAATNMLEGLRAMRRGAPEPEKQGQVAYAAMGSAARVVPTIVFQGTSDSLVNPVNGDHMVQQWMYTNRLASQGTYTASFDTPTQSATGEVEGGRSYTVYTWADTNGTQIQEYWKVHGLGHGWSGGNRVNSYTEPTGPDASLAMYRFFMKHPMSMLDPLNMQDENDHMLWGYLRTTRERFLKRFRPSSPEPQP